VYFAVAKRGDAPLDGGLSQAYGPHAAAFAERMTSHGVKCGVPGRAEFRQSMLEKLVWIRRAAPPGLTATPSPACMPSAHSDWACRGRSAYMLVGAAHGANVGEVEQRHGDEVDTLVDELAAAGAKELGVELARGDAPLTQRLAEYSRSVSHFPTAVKEFPWRNGWFWGISQARLAEGQPDPCPQHTALLKQVAPQLLS